VPTGVVLLAAGTSDRFGLRRPKPLVSLNGEPLFLKSFREFSRLPSVCEISLVVRSGEEKTYQRFLNRFKSKKKIHLISGGRFRGASVRNGVLALSKRVTLILVHDAARPLVNSKIIGRVEKAALKYGAALAAWPLGDTLKLSGKGGRVKKTIPRKNLWLAQTPQGFRRKTALKYLIRPTSEATDDVELVERKGHPVKIVMGDPRNLKVTYPFDLTVCRALVEKKTS